MGIRGRSRLTWRLKYLGRPCQSAWLGNAWRPGIAGRWGHRPLRTGGEVHAVFVRPGGSGSLIHGRVWNPPLRTGTKLYTVPHSPASPVILDSGRLLAAPTEGSGIRWGLTGLGSFWRFGPRAGLEPAPTAWRELPAQIGTHTVSPLCVGAAISRPSFSVAGSACANWDPSSPIPG